MQPKRNPYYLLNAVFVLGVLLLFINDHFLKFRFANWVTGKLSDAAGIIILPLLLTYLLPSLRRMSVPLSVALFIFWKSAFSQPFIDIYNQFAWISITRVVDYSDLCVFVLLPLPYFLLSRMDRLPFLHIHRVPPVLVVLPTLFILMATSPPPGFYYTHSDGNLKCYKCYFTVGYNQEEIVEKLGRHHVIFDRITPLDTLALLRMPRLQKENAHYYRLNSLVIGQDTFRNLDFTMRTIRNRNTRIYINGMQVSDTLSDAQIEHKLKKYYQRLLFNELKQRLQ
jgi:hypothetical protein